MVTEEQIQIVLSAQQYILDNPVRACVNSESCFVRDRISKQDTGLARTYWSWVCGPSNGVFSSDSRVVENQEKLDAVDGKFEMPKWGYSGT